MNITTRELSLIKPPMETATYKPVSFIDTFNATKRAFEVQTGMDVDISSVQHRVWKDNQRCETVFSPIDGRVKGLRPQITTLSSYDKFYPRTVIVGMQVLVCMNGMKSVNVFDKMKKKHTSDENLLKVYEHCFDEYDNHVIEMVRKTDSLKEEYITDAQASRRLINCVENSVFASSDIYKVWQEYKNPSYNYNDSDRNTMWQLYNAVTAYAKLIKQHQKAVDCLLRSAVVFGLSEITGTFANSFIKE